MKRRKEREFALQLLYALEFNPDPVESMLENMDAELKKCATTFSLNIINVCNTKQKELDLEIKTRLINWEFNRVAVIDKILLRMAMAEFLHFEDIPPEVTMNEIIEISKKYSTERSGKFINGILDAILKTLRSEKKLKKSGRGLIPKTK